MNIFEIPHRGEPPARTRALDGRVRAQHNKRTRGIGGRGGRMGRISALTETRCVFEVGGFETSLGWGGCVRSVWLTLPIRRLIII